MSGSRSKPRCAGLLLSVGLLAAVATTARGQATGYPDGWGAYAPGNPWAGYNARVAPVNPPLVVQPAAPAPARGWAGYAPARAWVGYQPQTAWQGYQPGVVNVAPRARVARGDDSLSPYPFSVYGVTGYREFGTGRRVPLAKPWLPGSP